MLQVPPEGTYTWGFVEWRWAGKVEATIPLRNTDGTLTGQSIHTKSVSVIDDANNSPTYFPNAVQGDQDMLTGPAEEMLYKVTYQYDDPNKNIPEQFYSFALGQPYEIESNQSYQLDFMYLSIALLPSKKKIYIIPNLVLA